MFNRRGTLLPLLLLAASKAHQLTAQAPAVQVLVYEFASLPSKPLHRDIKLTQQILTEAGLSLRVDLCPSEPGAHCATAMSSSRRLIIRVIPGGPELDSNVVRPSLAQSIADRQGGTYCSIFLQRVRDAAADANVPWTILLAYTTAHEVGHLLLGADAHTPQGLMKPDWGRAEYQAMNQHQLHFSKQQLEQLGIRFGEHSMDARKRTTER
jgi:hypothetical protein